MKIWNSGKAIAYNVDFKILDKCNNMVWIWKVSYEFLKPGKNLEDHVILHYGCLDKFQVTTTWRNKEWHEYSKDQIVSI